MKASHMIILLVIALVLVGCAKKAMTYEEALPKFHAGMNADEVEKAFGVPLTKVALERYVTWIYLPEPSALPKGHIDFRGFEIRFVSDKTTELKEASVTK